MSKSNSNKINLLAASRQWAYRPADERFWDLDEMRVSTRKAHEGRVEAMANISTLTVDLDDRRNFRLTGSDKDIPATLTHWSFSQLAARIGAPARYLQKLPDDLALQLVRHGLERISNEDKTARLSIRTDADRPTIEAFTSDRYAYIPNYEIVDRLKELESMGWKVPPARPTSGDSRARKATKDDVLASSQFAGLGIKEGDMIAPAGLYASDHDMFAFMVHEQAQVDDGMKGLNRGFFIRNSEVGGGACKLTTFLYDAVCGNHIVWGAQDVQNLSVRHVGKAKAKAENMLTHELVTEALADADEMTRKVQSARTKVIGKNQEETVDALFDYRPLRVTRKDLVAAWGRCEKLDSDRADPNTIWGMVIGFTRLSQESKYADARTEMDRVTERMMALV